MTYDWDRDIGFEAFSDEVINKTISWTAWEPKETHALLTLGFEDGTTVEIKSYDYEGYQSGLYLMRPEDAA